MIDKIKQKIKEFKHSKEMKKWRKKPYQTSVDYIFEEYIASKTNFKSEYIIVWIAKRDKLTKKFNEFKFKYANKYYLLKNNKLKEITYDDVFK